AGFGIEVVGVVGAAEGMRHTGIDVDRDLWVGLGARRDRRDGVLRNVGVVSSQMQYRRRLDPGYFAQLRVDAAAVVTGAGVRVGPRGGEERQKTAETETQIADLARASRRAAQGIDCGLDVLDPLVD